MSLVSHRLNVLATVSAAVLVFTSVHLPNQPVFADETSSSTEAKAESTTDGCKSNLDRDCILRLAIATAETIQDDHLRNDAWYSIVNAQIALHRFQEALNTASRMDNVEFIIRPSPIASIALAQAVEGDLDGVMHSASILANEFHRAGILADAAQAAVKFGASSASVRPLLGAAIEAAQQESVELLRFSAWLRIARAADAANLTDLARRSFDEAVELAEQVTDTRSRQAYLSDLAEALAASGRIDSALDFIAQSGSPSAILTAYPAVAQAQATAGNVNAAFLTAEHLQNNSRKVEALVRIAEARAVLGDLESARRAIGLARPIAQRVSITWEATDYLEAMRRVIGLQAAIGDVGEAIATARTIKDESIQRTALAAVASAELLPSQLAQLLAQAQDSDDPLTYSLSLLVAANAKINMNQRESALEIASAIMSVSSEIPDPELRSFVLGGLFLLRAGVGDLEGARDAMSAISETNAPSFQYVGMWREPFIQGLEAKANARNGNIGAALAFANSTEDPNQRVDLLARIATAIPN